MFSFAPAKMTTMKTLTSRGHVRTGLTALSAFLLLGAAGVAATSTRPAAFEDEAAEALVDELFAPRDVIARQAGIAGAGCELDQLAIAARVQVLLEDIVLADALDVTDVVAE